jgi:hypothetical protein
VSEQWLPVVGFEGAYEVSDRGRVRSLERVVASGRYTRRVSPRLLSPTRNPNGRLYIDLNVNGVPDRRWVHHLVLEAFVGPRPPGMEACHWNDVGHDNRSENLRWDTHSENMRDAYRNGRRKGRQRAFTAGASPPNEEVAARPGQGRSGDQASPAQATVPQSRSSVELISRSQPIAAVCQTPAANDDARQDRGRRRAVR